MSLEVVAIEKKTSRRFGLGIISQVEPREILLGQIRLKIM